MDKFSLLKDAKHSTHGLYWYLVIEGVLLIMLGLLVVFYPQILILLFSFFFILIGLASLWAGYKVRRFVKRFDKFFDLF